MTALATSVSVHSEYRPSHWTFPCRKPGLSFPSESSILRAQASPLVRPDLTEAREVEQEEEVEMFKEDSFNWLTEI